MSPDAIHPIKHPISLTVETALNAERRELVGDHTNRPARGITLGRRSAVGIWPVGLDLGWSFGLVSVTKWAKPTPDLYFITDKVGGTLGAVGGNYDPASHDRVFSKFWQISPFRATGGATNENILRYVGNVLEQLNLRLA